MVNKWRKLSPGDRLRWQIVIGLLVLAGFGMAHALVRKQGMETKDKLSRINNRISTQASIDPGVLNANPSSVKRQLEEVEKKLSSIKAEFNELDTGFVPADSSDLRQQLLVEISTLARRTGVELQTVARKGLEGKSGPDLLNSNRHAQAADMDSGPAAVDTALGRPLLLVTAVGQYDRLLAFLHGLKELSFYVSPMQIRLRSNQLKEGGKGTVHEGSDDGTLNISLELSM